MTVIVGKKTNTSVCRVKTLAEGADHPNLIEFKLPSQLEPLKSGKPSWANYVKGVVVNYRGDYLLLFQSRLLNQNVK